MESALISKKLEHIEEDIKSIRTLIGEKSSGKIVSLKGLLKGVDLTDNDLEEAKRSIFKTSYS